ncbi:AraC-type DNA-binding protein [Pedobacter steynii]|uniref:AraC-type DNA-binding protein n=1 Tax=Pedobacter steynii TaxID=430522 RepID=A0A1G9UND6_9SPHI|nr:helix-turn-helix domain-containing protein [Pedobacter steynii]NQX40822.1 AraC family transcriptional regulator [Pedobacter steynii]SDM61409.1 AraC-type DNA-binding protein [Pedobacter steynii]
MQYLIGAIIAVYIAILILGKKKKGTADYILAAWSFFAGLHLSYIYYYASGKYLDMPALIGWNAPIPLAHGPFFYAYVLQLTQQQKTRYRWLLVFAPFFLAYLYLLPKLQPLSDAAKISLLNGNQPPELKCEYLFPVLTFLIICSGVVYVAAVLVLLRKHKRNINEQLSNTERIRLIWIRHLITGIVIILSFFILGQAELTFLSVVGFIVFLGYFGIRQVGIISDETVEEEIVKTRYEKSTLTDEMAQKIHAELIAVMQTEQLYKAPDLSLNMLAKRLGVHPGLLSQVLNAEEQKSFYDYINEHRVNEFKVLVGLPENRNFTILAIAFDCGFNSKSSFNRNFKKITQLSPSAYVKQLQLHMAEE